MADGGATFALIASTAIAAGGTGASIHQQRKAVKAQEKADTIGKAAADIANQRQIRQNQLRTRVAQAQATAAGQAVSGGFGSSNIQGAIGSVQSQGASNLGNLNTQIASNNSIRNLNQQARGNIANAQTFGAIAELPGQFGFDTASVFKQFTDKNG